MKSLLIVTILFLSGLSHAAPESVEGSEAYLLAQLITEYDTCIQIQSESRTTGNGVQIGVVCRKDDTQGTIETLYYHARKIISGGVTYTEWQLDK